MMNRRNGVIAILAAVGGAFARAQSASIDRRYISLDLSPITPIGGEIDWEASKRLQGDSSSGVYLVQMKDPGRPIPQGIEIKLGSRVVRLSAEEIMDALERE